MYTECMAIKKRLSAEDRHFLSVVSDAAFSNPFGDERRAFDRQLIGESGELSDELRMTRLRQVVGDRLATLSGRPVRLSDYHAKDQETLRTAVLFEIYHNYSGDMDAHILQQLESGDDPCPVPFAREMLGHMGRHGFSAQECRRHLAVLFQIRRAYYFIDHALIGSSACMKELRRNLWNCVFTHDIRWYDRYLMGRMEDFSTLIFGETGTGKGTSAAAIGRSGFIPFDDPRSRFVESFTHSFVSINLSQYPESLIESELFGHRKGAFTGAVEDFEGVFCLCSPHGSILLDEIGEVSIPVQIKLLQVLQERWFSPVGSHERSRFHGRVIAATNRSIDDLRQCGSFRDDFFYRLCSQVITVPPLRQRIREDPGELDTLMAHTLRRLIGEDDPQLTETIRAALRDTLPADYPWAGNVRELEQCVRRLLLTKQYRPLPSISELDYSTRLLAEMQTGSLSARELVSSYCSLLFNKHGSLAEVARRTVLDRRTVKKHVEQGQRRVGGPS